MISGPFNDSPAHTGNGSYSLDGKRFYFTECNPNDSLQMICNIYVSEYAAGEWSKPKPLNDVNAAYRFTTTHPCIGGTKGKRSSILRLTGKELLVEWISGTQR